MISILSARFLKSVSNFSQSPEPIYPEVAFLGRSNVGKSTLINLLVKKKLAKSSQTPGKTRLINYFHVDFKYDECRYSGYFIDFPGIGYAKVPKSIYQFWEENLWDFLCRRSSIKLFVLLIDSRHTDLIIDQKMRYALDKICSEDQKVLEIYTKCDKISSNTRALLANKGCLLMSQNNIFKAGQGGRQRVLEALFKGMFHVCV